MAGFLQIIKAVLFLLSLWKEKNEKKAEEKEVEKEEEKSSKVLWSLLGGFGALGAVAAISTVFGIMTSGPPASNVTLMEAFTAFSEKRKPKFSGS